MLAPLTGLRFVAAVAVVLYHVPLPSGTPHAIIQLVSRGYLGVSLFFVLSGFILTYTYIDPAGGSLRGSVREFWWARIARIYPVYAAALALSLPIFILFRIVMAAPDERPGAILSATLTPLLLQAWWPTAATQWNTPGWSLSVEIFFYALFPLTAGWLARRPSAWRASLLIWAGCLIPPVVYIAVTPGSVGGIPPFDQYFWLQAVKFNPLGHLGEFAVGVAAGLAFLRRGLGSRLSSPALSRIVPVGVVAATLAVVFTDRVPYVLAHAGLLAPLWALVILRLAAGRGAVARLLGSHPLVRLGEASYALYLVHSPLLGYQQLLRGFVRLRRPDLAAPSTIQVFLFLAVALGLSFLLFRHVEEPGRRAIRARTMNGTRAAQPLRTRGSRPVIRLARTRVIGVTPEIIVGDE